MSDYHSLLTQIIQTLETAAKHKEPLTENSDLVTGLGLTSLELMQLICQIEDDFDISIPINILPEIRTIGDLVREVQKLI